MFNAVRSFFFQKKILEVDPPALSKNPAIDIHIEVMKAEVLENEFGYLHTSPEYMMKRLLSQNIGDIYFLGHVFRKSEMGNLHNVEFTMAEWYRKDISYEDFIEETLEFIRLFLPVLSSKKKSYRKTFYEHTNIDYLFADEKLLSSFASKHINFEKTNKLDKDGYLNLIMSHLVEPNLGINELYVIDSYPPSQAALAQIEKKDEEIAKRFEIYYQGIELANGFHELQDAKEQEKRFIKANEERKKMGKEEFPLDCKFLDALKKGIGNCCGVAAGFDRLFMLKHRKQSLKEVIPFSWDET